MVKRTWNERGIEKERQTALEESTESRLCTAAHKIVPDESARKRIVEGVKQGQHGRRNLAFRVPAAVAAVCLFFSVLCFARPGVIGEDVVVYAATEENGWQKLKEGERILLKKEPFEKAWTDEDFYESGRCTYYPYRCVFRVEVPEHYVYDRQMIMIRDDDILEFGDRIEWWVAPDRLEDADRVMQNSFRLWIINENLERQAALELELTKEDGKCYAELKRVWESEAYRKQRHGK